MLTSVRALHHVLKIGSLKENIYFFRDKLKMKVLRHEVFGEGCKAACNGPYEGQWTKTMIGYGPESGIPSYFVLELTYNYSIKSYKLGNDLNYIKLAVNEDLFKELSHNQQVEEVTLHSPDGYKFIVVNLENESGRQDITEVCLSVSNLEKSLRYWRDTLNMTSAEPIDENPKSAKLSYDSDNQVGLRLLQIDEELDHGKAYGRTAFSIPTVQLKRLEDKLKKEGYKILVPLLSLETEGKATVDVVICADPDGHEICFVGDEGFRLLSQPDEKIENLYF